MPARCCVRRLNLRRHRSRALRIVRGSLDMIEVVRPVPAAQQSAAKTVESERSFAQVGTGGVLRTYLENIKKQKGITREHNTINPFWDNKTLNFITKRKHNDDNALHLQADRTVNRAKFTTLGYLIANDLWWRAMWKPSRANEAN
ncbi:hypothetical protein KIN20_009528 [Parelaphostrongylus tenuis]|uniref:Uncharacterized protein n=1 Tax=Parelaphostrongylus tenuis TaxID=148309 RepID=A0AAD5QNE8_PARTN|nr:hypothetical protein KIN20_009528 [Parelaphostrongylus tenuis]